MSTVDIAALLAPRLPEDTVEIAGIGTFRVRGLSRIEAISVQAGKGTANIERKMIALGLLEPKLTEDEVGTWMRNAPAGELSPISDRIAELSGMAPGSEKGAYKSDGPGSDA